MLALAMAAAGGTVEALVDLGLRSSVLEVRRV
jgi:hypothetical protein